MSTYFFREPHCIASLIILRSYVGGNGGRGGDVILECSPAVWDFSSVQHHIVCYFLPSCWIFFLDQCIDSNSYFVKQNGKRGGHGASKNQIGSRGADKVMIHDSFFSNLSGSIISMLFCS